MGTHADILINLTLSDITEGFDEKLKDSLLKLKKTCKNYYDI